MDVPRSARRFLIRTSPSSHLLTSAQRFVDRLQVVLSAVYVSIVVALIGITCYIYFTLLRHLVHQRLPRSQAILHTTVSIYLILSVIINYAQCLLCTPGSPPSGADPESQPTIKNVNADEKGGEATLTRSETWRYCMTCRALKPPRSHHCTACNACYYKLCHHCPAIGKCVGRDNYPFFFRFVMTSWWGGLFAAATCAVLRSGGVTDAATEDTLFFMTIGGCAVGVAVGVLGTWHLYLLLSGQTTIEWLENMQMRRRGLAGEDWGRWGGPFSQDLRHNIREGLGEVPLRLAPWWIVLCFPVRRMAMADDH